MHIGSSTSFQFIKPAEIEKTTRDQYGMQRTGDAAQEEEVQFNLASCCRRPLAEDEQKKLEELKQELIDLLKDPENITPEKERRIRLIEKEIEKLTGIRLPKRNLSSMTKMLGDMNGDNDEEKKQPLQDLESKAMQAEHLRSILRPMEIAASSTSPSKGIMNFAIAAYGGAGTSLGSMLAGSVKNKT